MARNDNIEKLFAEDNKSNHHVNSSMKRSIIRQTLLHVNKNKLNQKFMLAEKSAPAPLVKPTNISRMGNLYIGKTASEIEEAMIIVRRKIEIKHLEIHGK